jgi:glycosyltransferase involved in cell wall biosynthesis
MKIANVFLGKIMGGIEQAFLDYTKALAARGYEVLDFVHRDGLLKDRVPVDIPNIRKIEVPFRKRSPLSFWALYTAVRTTRPDLILVHYKKALGFFRLIGKMLDIPVVAVAHNPKTKHILNADFIFSITEYQRQIFMAAGYPADRIFVVPNMIQVTEPYEPVPPFHKPPVIGVLGRFDPMKGFDTFVEALSELDRRGIDFRARIAGSADRAYEDFHRKVLDMIRERGLENKVDRVGWIDIKKDFYSTLDIFVLPSNFEPFGIVLLEAMAFSKPVIASTAEGPSEIFADNGAALLFEKGNAGDLADKIAEMISDPARAAACAEKGYELVRSRYDLETTGAETLDRAVKSVFERL